MTVILDTGPIVAAADLRDPRRLTAQRSLATTQRLILPAPVTAEIHYLLGVRAGTRAQRGFIEDLAAGLFEVACLEPHEYRTLAEVDARYADLGLGLSDCAIVVLAARYRTTRLLSFDQRHFRAVSPLQGGAFTLLPQDED